MLIKRVHLDGIVEGRIQLQFRRWKRPTVKRAGTLLTRVGQLSIDAVDIVEEASLTDEDARASGFRDRDTLLAALPPKADSHLYRIRLHASGPDPRIALRAVDQLTDSSALELSDRLKSMDLRASDGPWTRATLEIIAERPAVLAATLAKALGSTKAIFKPRVRRLKALGLTESLEVGYRLSPRGTALLAHLRGVD